MLYVVRHTEPFVSAMQDLIDKPSGHARKELRLSNGVEISFVLDWWNKDRNPRWNSYPCVDARIFVFDPIPVIPPIPF